MRMDCTPGGDALALTPYVRLQDWGRGGAAGTEERNLRSSVPVFFNAVRRADWPRAAFP